MKTSPLEKLGGPGKALKAEPPDAREFDGLKRSGRARMKDALNLALPIESRFDLVYNAAPALGEYEGDLNIDDRIVTDLVAACQAVVGQIDALASLSDSARPGR